MRHVLAIVLALSLVGCGDDTITYLPGENHKTVLVSILENGEVFLSTKDSPIALQELPKEIESLLSMEEGYSFVIQSEDGGLAAKVEEILHKEGVKDWHVAIAQNRP